MLAKKSLQKIVLEQIEILIMFGEDEPTRALGCIYVLMVFTSMNPDIGLALPAISQEYEDDF